MHSQNLTDGRLPLWRHGRAWAGRWRACWTIFYSPSFGLGLYKGGIIGDGDEILIQISLLIFSLWISYDCKRQLKQRELSLSIHHWGLWLNLFTTDEDWIRDRPWHRNTIHISLIRWLIGKPVYTCTVVPHDDVLIPMPEGCYKAKAKLEKRVWRYWFGYIIRREGWWFDIEGGIPFQGKGENSWDCGPDALCGCGGTGTIEEVIGKTVAKALENRLRYGSTTDKVVMA